MSYLQETLFSGEELVHMGKFHWIYDFTAYSYLLLPALAGLAGLFYLPPLIGQYIPASMEAKYVAGGLFVVLTLYGFLNFLVMMLRKRATEMVVTNRRLIFKRGLVARRTDEVNIDRIEGCNVFQSFWGRILGYGIVVVRGTGIGEIVLPVMEEPLQFRRAIDHAQMTEEELESEQDQAK
ncbi:MAG: PH domain-containing protein [Alphaproteobacteria bacterium]|nr:PH domain-containing protein [Alphaproteobacteria bacterium SS10]